MLSPLSQSVPEWVMAKIQNLRTMLAVNDPDETVSFYEKVLGFTCIGKMAHEEGAKPFWFEVRRDEVDLMFTYSEPHEHEPGEEHSHDPALSGALYLNVDDADALFAEAKANGATFEQEPTTQPYGMRDFSLVDPNGYLLIFGSPVEAAAPGDR